MPITEKQRQLRRERLGSSDIAAILGVSPYGNAYDVWLDKTGKITDQEENEAMMAGTMFEDGVLKWAEGKLGKFVTQDNEGGALFFPATGFPIGSHVDAIVVNTGEPVEAKTSGLLGPLQQEWGDEGTDQVPDHVIIQGHVHMLCTEKPICHIAAFLGGIGFRPYVINEDKEIMDTIKDESINFWDSYVEKDCPPPDVMPSLVVAKRMKREPDKIVTIDDVIIEQWQNAKEGVKRAEAIKKSITAELLAKLGDAEGGKCGFGMVTYFQQTANKVDIKRLKEDDPETAKKFMYESKSRVLRFKKPPKSKGGK